MRIRIKTVRQPKLENIEKKVMITDETIELRKNKLIELMKEYNYSSLVVYADKEHGSNFEYLTGFIPRFEEALLVLNVSGSISLVLGNENYNKVKFSRSVSQGVKCPLFSLPNQPMDFSYEMVDYLRQATIDDSNKVGLVGWKLLSQYITDDCQQFDIPEFIVNGMKELVGEDSLFNATHLFIDAGEGARSTNTANEIAHYEYGASLASDGVLDAMNHLQVGVSEVEVGDKLNRKGQYNNVVSIAAFGDRFVNANIYPTDKKLKNGDKVALTVSYKGGLSSRSGYAVCNMAELEQVDKGYIEKVVEPYFLAYCYWLDNLKIGERAHDFYHHFNDFYPQTKYGWELCPGHLVADEEWLSSPFYDGSKATIRSGMIFQLDYIPIQEGHQGISAESTLAIADSNLREELSQDYPELWSRIISRRNYLKEELGIELQPEILPLTNTLGYIRPFLLDNSQAITLDK